MIHTEGYFETAHSDKRYYQSWLPEGNPKAALVVVHGLAEHCGRYINIVNRFVPQGYVVYALDHLGHGKSDGTRVYVDRFNDFIQPLRQFVEMVHGWQPGLAVFIVGHSLGGLISSVYLLDYQAGLRGAILTGAAVKVPDNITQTTILISKVLSVLAPKAGVASLEVDAISRDPAVVQAYIDDPLNTTGKTSARLGAEMLKAMQRVGAEAPKIQLPVLIMHGGADRLVSPEASKLLYERVNSPDKTLRIWDGYYHELYNEPRPEREAVFCEMEAWLEERR
jgi:acylglycerol lipase